MTRLADQLRLLLPPVAYDPNAPMLSAVIEAEARALETALQVAEQLAGGLWADNPEYLLEHERVLGLPDPCVAFAGLTVRQRMAAVLAKLRGAGGQSKAFFIELAASLGYTITITEFHPARAGVACAGDALNGGGWESTWRVNAPETTHFPALAGATAAGEALDVWGNKSLECRLAAMQPAHLHLIFGYGDSNAEDQ